MLLYVSCGRVSGAGDGGGWGAADQVVGAARPVHEQALLASHPVGEEGRWGVAHAFCRCEIVEWLRAVRQTVRLDGRDADAWRDCASCGRISGGLAERGLVMLDLKSDWQ